jgi:colanic acid biosynthesis glycosyl transferase WcaI
MRITIVNRYFWPESVLVNDISRWLAARGHDVEVLTGQPDYNPEVDFSDHRGHEIWNGVRIRRILSFRSTGRGMLRNFISLLYVATTSVILLFGPRRDVVWLTSIPPIVQPLLMRIVTGIRGTKLLYFPQDIYPEIAVSSELMREGIVASVLRALDSWVIRKADRVVTISHDMARHLKSRSGLAKEPTVIRSFAPVEKERPDRNSSTSDLPVRFVFAGNIGRFQNLDSLISAFALVSPKLAVLDVLGNGREKARLQALVQDSGIQTVRFHDFVPVEQAFEFVSRCQIGVVSLRPGIFKFAFPAKTYTYVGAGLPIFAIVERESELARLVEERDIGIAVSWDQNANAIAEAIAEMAQNYDRFLGNLYKKTDDLYLPDLARQQWIDVIESMSPDRDQR